tara:strand:+ start:8192 stop:9226 length:1035 start_codon:yes stop_codon:yes gene_type:complete
VKKIILNQTEVFQGSKPYIIAEACINHGGKIELAFKMIEEAKKAGSNCIKFQFHVLEDEMLRVAPKSDNFKDDLWTTLHDTNFTLAEHDKLKNYCEKLKIDYLCTPFSRAAVDLLDKLNVNFFKVGSGELTNIPLQKYVATKKKPTIISTGMSEIQEIHATLNEVQKINKDIILTQCTSIYPCPYEFANLKVIEILNKKFNVPVGLSDHSSNCYTSYGAVAHGACVIEKHFTLDKNQVGPDHKSSLEPKELKNLVDGCNAIFLANGKVKKIFDEEKQIIAWARESVVSIKDIKKGDTLSKENLWVKRPAPLENVVPASDFEKILGKKAIRNILVNTQVKFDDFE